MSEMMTDVVVVGAGASGIGAALTVIEAGQSVILLEKGDKYGGAGMFGAQGLFAVESKQQKAENIRYSVKEAYEELMNYTHYRSNARLTKKILVTSAQTIEWLAAHGLDTELVKNTQEVHQARPKVYHQYIDKFAGFQRLMHSFINKGGILLTKTEATDLLTAHDRISGVQATQEGKALTIHCQTVIMADGGFVGNSQMVKKYLTIDPSALYSMGERKATGDGIRMLAKLGADTRHMGVFENHAASVVSKQNSKWHNSTIFTLTNLPFLWLSPQGERFVDESVCYDFALWGNATYTAGGFYYFILDQALVDYLKENSLDWTDSFERTFKSLSHESMTHRVGPFPSLESDLKEAVEEAAAWKSDNLASLASRLGVNSETLEMTIGRYNELIDGKVDNDFYKPSQFMRFKITKGPYYAIKAQSTTLGTIGGIETNDHLEALNQEGNPILGAYVTGNNASGIYDTSYPTLEGISCAFAWNSGRIAGESAAKYCQTKTASGKNI
ncbi:MAG: FAD-dependent oxidoreductase [Sporolactobacillus sp.]